MSRSRRKNLNSTILLKIKQMKLKETRSKLIRTRKKILEADCFTHVIDSCSTRGHHGV